MRITTKSVSRWDEALDRYVLVSEQCYDYEGPIAQCKGSNQVNETPEEKTVAQIGAEKYGLYTKDFVPYENQYINDVQNIDSTPNQHYALGRSAGAVEQSYAPALAQTQSSQIQAGAAPGSGRFDMATAGIGNQYANTAANAFLNTSNNLQNMHYQGLEKLVDLGSGQANNAQIGLGQVATNATNQAINNGFVDQYNRAATGQAIGQAAGIGAGIYQNYPSQPKDTGVVATQGAGDFYGASY